MNSNDLFFLSVIEMLKDNMYYFRPIFESNNDEFHGFLANGVDSFTYTKPKSVPNLISGMAYIHIGKDRRIQRFEWGMRLDKSIDGGSYITFSVGDHHDTTKRLHDMDEVIDVFKGVIYRAAGRYKNNLSWKEPYNK